MAIFFGEYVSLSAHSAGMEFVRAESNAQAEFLDGMLLAIFDLDDRSPWASQCRVLAGAVPKYAHPAVIDMLETLLDAFKADEIAARKTALEKSVEEGRQILESVQKKLDKLSEETGIVIKGSDKLREAK